MLNPERVRECNRQGRNWSAAGVDNLDGRRDSRHRLMPLVIDGKTQAATAFAPIFWRIEHRTVKMGRLFV
jgi:hypothetical protein